MQHKREHKAKRKSGHKKSYKKNRKEHGFSHLGGSALNLIGNLAGKVVASAIKSDATRSKLGNEMIKDAKGQAIQMATGHVDNLANALQQKTGVKVDTSNIKQAIVTKANTIQIGGDQIGGGFTQYGAAFPLALVGNIASKLVTSAAKSGVANQLIKGVQANASTIGKALVADAQKQAIQMANQQIDKMASQVQQQTGVKVDTSELKQKVEQKTQGFF